MTEMISLSDWLAYLGSEYIEAYVGAGGASVKFTITEEPAGTSKVCEHMRNLAIKKGFVPIDVNAAVTKVHMIDRIFFACATEVPWGKLTDAALKRFTADEGFPVPAEIPVGQSFAQSVAEHADTDINFVRQALRQRVQTHVFKDRAMIRDFRLAMTWLCQKRLTGDPTMLADSDLVQQWLMGRMPRITALKHLGIFTKINRTNARLHLESLLHWLRVARIPGIALILNIDRLLEKGRRSDGEHYSRPAMMDSYEVLRQFIDSVDALEGLLLVVVANEAILDPDHRQRGLAAYKALRDRVYDEVRDRTHENPAGSLVRLATRGAQ